MLAGAERAYPRTERAFHQPMSKVDLKKTDLKYLYGASSRAIEEVDVPALRYLAIDGKGDPNTEASYREALEALYSVSYAVKFMAKSGGFDYVVMPLEGLWWAEDMSVFAADQKSDWCWTMMIHQPDAATDALIHQAINDLTEKKHLPGLQQLRVERLQEGRCAQVLHRGPFSEEGPTIERLHDYIRSKGELVGKHHEIYLSDIRRAKPENWKTVLRQPMRPR